MKHVYLWLFLLVAPPARVDSPQRLLDHAGGGLLDLPEKEEKEGEQEKREEKEERRNKRRGKKRQSIHGL